MRKCWKATIKFVGGGGWCLSQKHRTWHVIDIGKASKGVSGSGVSAESSTILEALLRQVTISAGDSVRLHPWAWMWFGSAFASVPLEGVEWQQQHFGFVVCTRGHGAPSQQTAQQQEPFAP